jgi:hypothetical protein
MIRKLPNQNKWRIYSKKTGKNLGTFPSRKKAENHEADINYFKHKK